MIPISLPPIYSRRKRQTSGKAIDVYDYDSIPERLAVQAVQIVQDAVGEYYNEYGSQTSTAGIYDYVVKELQKELGVHKLSEYARHPKQELFKWMETTQETDIWLDALEMLLQCIDTFVRDRIGRIEVTQKPDDAIAELNARMLEAGFGYQFVDGVIVRIDSQHLHQTVVLPVLELLSQPEFSNANKEYREAHQAYRHGDYEACVGDCGKAFESVLKVIGKKRGWTIKDTDPASRLVQAGVDAGFLASYSQAALNHLKGLIESSTPTLRNKVSAHGAGTSPRVVPAHLAAFQLHQTAAVILFLAEQDASQP